MGTIRLLHYPRVEDDATSFSVGIGAHTDFEVFTLMHQSAPGLQLRAASLPPAANASAGGAAQVAREWEDAPVRPGQFVVILGDVLERMTKYSSSQGPEPSSCARGSPC